MAEALSSNDFGPASRLRAGIAAPEPRFTTVLAVENMHCGGCMKKVETALLKVPHVVGARTNLSNRRVSITTDITPATVEPFTLALDAAGFKATVLPPDPVQAEKLDDADHLKRLGVAGFAAANIMLLSVAVWSGHSGSAKGDMPQSLQTLFHWLSAMIALPAIAYAGQPFFASARRALAARALNMDVPISLGVTLATAMSLYQTVRGSEQVYFDAAITLLFFLLVGRTLDQRMRRRAKGAAENLLGLRAPVTSVLQADGTMERVATTSVAPGTRFLVAAGECIPLDAKLVRGDASIDESLISGESRPRHVLVGDALYSGTVALSGPLEAEATAVADDTLLADIARLMQSAEQAKGRYVRLADQAARLYAPAVHMLGAATFLGWLAVGHGWEQALTAAIAVLIITCPCALALAVPVVQVVASSRLFRSGLILKAADGLERMAEVDTIVLDKTGTLTRGMPELVDPASVPDPVLARAAALAANSRHPYAQAVVRAAMARNIGITPAKEVEEVGGSGMRAVSDGRTTLLGSARFCGVSDASGDAASLWFREGDGAPLALRFEDQLRTDAVAVVKTLQRQGYKLEILSGDRNGAVAEAAAKVGITEWRGEQKPNEKIARLAELKDMGRKVLMIGDGLNDAPALAAGHASLSPSTAVDVAQTAADAIFQGSRLQPVIDILAVAKAARSSAMQNFAIALGYNAVFVPLAMAGVVTPLIAAIAMSASSIAVTANALRLGGGSTPEAHA